jgi:Nif-specific regulatory protein
LRQLTGRGAGRRLTLDGMADGTRLRVGRSEASDFVIDEDHISGSHLEILADERGVFATDLRSTNGSVLVRGDQQIPLDRANGFTVEMRDGDVLHLGDPVQPIHLTYSDGSITRTRTKQEILAVAHMTGVPEYENRLQQHPETISSLYKVAKELTAAATPADAGRVACEGVFEVSKAATHVAISLEDSKQGRFFHFIGLDREGELLDDEQISNSIIEEVRKNKAGLLVSDTTTDDAPAKSIIRLGIRTLMAVPLTVGERVTGVIQADNRGSGGIFTQQDLEAFTVLASQVSLAVENARLISHLRSAEARLEEENKFFKEGELKRTEIKGESQAIHDVLALIEKVRNTRVAVCIEGETGTGKELVARAIHYRSNRRSKLFVTQNCAAIPESILESELFGHVRGAFTSADRDKKGLFALADGGTIFLDEIAETTSAMQAKLLRVLQEGEIRPVGAVRSQNVDVRVISATNRNLEEEVEQGRFREDLYYRLKVFPIRLPPLRERREDIPILARHFLDQYCREAKRGTPTFSPEALALLMAYRWPGNIRELQNEMQRLVIAGTEDSDFVLPDHLSERLRRPGDVLEKAKPKRGGLKQMLQEVEKWIILDALREHGNNKTQTAETLQISREGLHKKLARFGLN